MQCPNSEHCAVVSYLDTCMSGFTRQYLFTNSPCSASNRGPQCSTPSMPLTKFIGISSSPVGEAMQ